MLTITNFFLNITVNYVHIFDSEISKVSLFAVLKK